MDSPGSEVQPRQRQRPAALVIPDDRRSSERHDGSPVPPPVAKRARNAPRGHRWTGTFNDRDDADRSGAGGAGNTPHEEKKDLEEGAEGAQEEAGGSTDGLLAEADDAGRRRAGPRRVDGASMSLLQLCSRLEDNLQSFVHQSS